MSRDQTFTYLLLHRHLLSLTWIRIGISLGFSSLALQVSLAYANPHQQQGSYPHRIISLSLASDETVYELLKRQNRLSHLVAVSAIAHDQRYSFLAQLFKQPSPALRQVPAQIEPVLKLNPDLVIAADFNNPKLLTHLNNQSIPFVVLKNFTSIASIKSNINLIGTAIGATKPAAELVAEIDQELHQQSHLTHPPPAISMMMFSQSGYVVGRQTLFDDLLRQSGFINTINSTGWIKLNLEALIQLQPHVIVAACPPSDHLKMLAHLRQQRGWSSYQALQSQRLICISPRALHSTSFHIIQALRQLKAGYRQLTTANKTTITTTAQPQSGLK